MRHNVKNYQKVVTLGLYYLGCIFLTVVIAFPLRGWAEHLDASGFQNMTVVSYIMVITLFSGLFINGISLLGFSADIPNLEENDIAHRTRTYYINPFVNLLVGFVGGISIWVVLKFLSIIVEEVSYFGLVALFLSIISLRASNSVERLIFAQDI